MPDPFDLHAPLPDLAHEALRQAVVHALDELETQVQRISDAFLLLVSTADFAQSTLSTAISGRAAIAQLEAAARQIGQQASASNTQAKAAQVNATAALDGMESLQELVTELAGRVTALESLNLA